MNYDCHPDVSGIAGRKGNGQVVNQPKIIT